MNALLTLVPGEAVPMRSLAARLDYDASNLSVLVDRLERRGAVERRPDPGDRRVKALALTAEGERLREAFWRDLVEDAGRSPRSPARTCGRWPRSSAPSASPGRPVRLTPPRLGPRLRGRVKVRCAAG